MGNKCCVSATSNPCKSRKVQNFNYDSEAQQPNTPTARLPPLHQATTMPQTNKHASQRMEAETLRGHERSNSLVNNSFKSSHRRGIQQINIHDEDEERDSRHQEDNDLQISSQGQQTRRVNSNSGNFTRPGTQQVEHDFQGGDNQVNLLGSNLNVSPIVNQKMADKNKPASPSSQKTNKNLTLQHARTHQPPTRSSARSQTSAHTEGIPQRQARLSGKNSLDQEQSIQQEEELEMQDEGPLIQSKRSNPQVTCIDQIDIPKLKVSTTIGISKEWLPPNHQKSSVFPSSDQNVEEEAEEYYISDDAGVLRKKSSIHQLSFQKQSTISPKIMQYQKSLHPDFNPQATIGPLSFGGPVEGLEFTLQKNNDRDSKGRKTGGRIQGQGTITSSLDMSIHSFNPNAKTNINPALNHQNSMSRRQKQSMTQHSLTQTGNNSRSNNTSHNGTKRQETSQHSKFRNKPDLRANTMDDDELIESAGSAFSREGSSVVGINIIDGSADVAIRKDSFISQDIVSQQEKFSSNLNTHMIESDHPYPTGSVLLPTPPSAQLKNQQYLSIFGNTNGSQGGLPSLQQMPSLSADPSALLDDKDKNRVTFGIRMQSRDFRQQNTAQFMQDSFIKQPSYREGGNSNASKNSRRGSVRKKTSNEFDNKNFGNYLNDLLFSKAHSRADEDDYSSPVLGKNASTSKNGAPIQRQESIEQSPLSQKKRSNNLLMSLAQMPGDLRQNFQIQVENCSPEEQALIFQSISNQASIPTMPSMNGGPSTFAVSDKGMNHGTMPSQDSLTAANDYIDQFNMQGPPRNGTQKRKHFLHKFESIDDQIEIQNILEQLLPLNNIGSGNQGQSSYTNSIQGATPIISGTNKNSSSGHQQNNTLKLDFSGQSPSSREVYLQKMLRQQMLEEKNTSLKTLENQFGLNDHQYDFSPMLGNIKQASEKLLPIDKDKDMVNVGLNEALQLLRKQTQNLNNQIMESNLGPSPNEVIFQTVSNGVSPDKGSMVNMSKHYSIPIVSGSTLEQKESIMSVPRIQMKQPSMVLRPLKRLTSKLNNDYDQLQAILEERKEDKIQKQMAQLKSIIKVKPPSKESEDDFVQLLQLQQVHSTVSNNQLVSNFVTQYPQPYLSGSGVLPQVKISGTFSDLSNKRVDSRRASNLQNNSTSKNGANQSQDSSVKLNTSLRRGSGNTHHHPGSSGNNQNQQYLNNQSPYYSIGSNQNKEFNFNSQADTAANAYFTHISAPTQQTFNQIQQRASAGSAHGQKKYSFSPLALRKISDLSPLAETIEVSEDILAGGTILTENISDNSFTRSDARSVSMYMKSDISLSHSVIEVEYEGQLRDRSATPKHLRPDDMTPKESIEKVIFNTSQEDAKAMGELDQQAQTTRPQREKRQIFRPKPVYTQIKSQENNTIAGCDSALLKLKEKQPSVPNALSAQQQVSVNQSHANPLTQKNLEKRPSIQTNNNDFETVSNRSFLNREVNVSQSVIKQKQNGKKKINQYILMKDIGKGSFGKVKMVLDTSNNNLPCAMKVMSKRKLNKIFISKNRTAMHDVQQEIAIMKKLDHINVVRLYEVLDDPSVDKLYIIMEFVKNGSLMTKLSKSKTIQPQHLWKYFRDLLAGLHYLHECAGIIHRDLKPENILIDEVDRAKISDFGVSFIVENGCDEIQSTAGSNYFFAPEVCNGDTYKGKKSDIWAIGVTLYFMMFKKYPFNATNIPTLYNKILNNEPDYPADANMLLIDLLKKLFIKDPIKRISLQEIIQHDWVTSNGIQPLQIHLYPQITVNPSDATLAIQRVSLIAKIRLRVKAKVQEQKKRKALAQVSASQQFKEGGNS